MLEELLVGKPRVFLVGNPRSRRHQLKGNRSTLTFMWNFLLKLIRCTLDVTVVFLLFRFIDLYQLLLRKYLTAGVKNLKIEGK